MTSSKALAISDSSAGVRLRMAGVMISCLALASALVVRASFVQVANNPRLEQMARRQFQSKVLIRPRRGAILDRNGEPLAINLEVSSLAANPAKVEDKAALAKLLARATDLPYKRILARLREKKEFVWIKRQLADGELARFRKQHVMDADGGLVGGLWLVKESKRIYPHGELAAHLLGDVNVDSEGLEGAELWQNEKLRGKVISVAAVKDALGRPTFIDAATAQKVQEHKDGDPVSLTVDASLQYAVEQALRAAVQRTGARGGSVIVMNAVSGEVLAMANAPSYNPNDKGAPPDHRRNRALTDGYEPGSTMKAVLASSALSHGWKLTDQVFAEHGTFKVQGHKISEAEAREKFDWISLSKLIQVSSNVGAAKVALKLGADHYSATLKAMGFGARTGTGFPGEISGMVPQRKAWQPLTLANIGFGQGVLVTPMQMTRAYAAFLNGGWLVQPRLLKDSPGAKPVRVLSQKVADQVLEALEGVTQDGGTGLKARLTGYRVAGKTGTAQKVEPGTRAYSRSRHVSSFIGYALGVEPKIVIFTALDEPHGVYFASETAAPLFREVLNAVASRFSLPATDEAPRALAAGGALGKGVGFGKSVGFSKSSALGRSAARPEPFAKGALLAVAPVPVIAPPPAAVPAPKVAAPPASDASDDGLSDAVAVSRAHFAPAPLEWQGAASGGALVYKMPALRGLTPREAIRALQGHPFKLEMRGTGVVQAQSPAEGRALAEGETVRLTLGEP